MSGAGAPKGLDPPFGRNQHGPGRIRVLNDDIKSLVDQGLGCVRLLFTQTILTLKSELTAALACPPETELIISGGRAQEVTNSTWPRYKSR